MQFNRDIRTKLLQLGTHFKVLVLTGARQTGKTTLLKALFPKHRYVTLDLPQDAAQAEHAPTEFFARHPPPVLIDEVQYAPALFRHLKVHADTSAQKGQYVLTGSQRFSLMKSVSESLAGRAAVLELHGLSCSELGAALQEFKKEHHLAGVLARGFFPALWEDTSLPANEFYRSYVATWLQRDLRQMLNVGSLRDFDRFLRACAARSAQLLNKSELARDLGLSVATITQWLSVLEAAGLIVILEPYFNNSTKRLIKTPKLYFADVGLLAFLLGLDARALQTYGQLGALWETFVLGELLKWKEVHHPEAQLFFYRDKEGVECDFVVQQGGGLHLLDAKLSELPEPNDARGLRSAQSKLRERIDRLALVTPSASNFPLAPDCDVWSGWTLTETLSISTDQRSNKSRAPRST